MGKTLFVGLIVGLLIGFIDSYSYAISGYTTAEISLIVIPFLSILFFKILRVRCEIHDVIAATTLAYGICITTTLTSGMYITYGFLSYVSRRLRAYGLEVIVPQSLFSGVFPDYAALPLYISLALLSFSGALVAFTLRGHFIEKERLRYPIGLASAVLTKLLIKTSLPYKSMVAAVVLGFILQFIAMRKELFLDLTPVISSIFPGAILALSFWPIVIGLLFILPLDPLKMMSIGSTTTYLISIPLAIALFKIKVLPALRFDDALFSYSTIAIGLNIGVVLILLIFYLIMYSKIMLTSIVFILKLKMERAMFVFGVIMISLLGYIAVVLTGLFSAIPYLIPVIFLHIVLTIANLRVVGESGTGSQALLPLVTMYMYSIGVRDVTTYAVIDPFSGIPMPQVVGGSFMNLIRFARFFGYNVVKLVLYFGFGVLVGSITTYLYGNILVHIYGFESPYMPLTRWIPTVVWMTSVYHGKLGAAPYMVIVMGLVMGLILVLVGIRRNTPLFPFVVGMTMPPDVGVLSLAVFLIKSIFIKLGVEAHEKGITLSILFLVGCGLAVILNTLISLILA